MLIPGKARLVGGSGEGKRKIFISKDVYREIFSFSKDKTVCEAGGILLGETVVNEEISCTIITAFIEAKHSEGTSNSITFTKDTWNYIDKEREQYPEYELVGWMHTNPDTGCKATEYDAFFHSHIFEDENGVAYIVDPVQIVEAFYFLEEGKMVKSDGFYIFSDNVFKKQKKENEKQKEKETEKQAFIIDDTEQAESSDDPEGKGETTRLDSDSEEDIRNAFETAESKVEADTTDIEADEYRISDNVELADINIHEHTSLRVKVIVSILGVAVAVLAIAVGVMAIRITQLEKDIDSLYQNDEVIAKYINGEETTVAESITEAATEAVRETTTAAKETTAAAGETTAPAQ